MFFHFNRLTVFTISIAVFGSSVFAQEKIAEKAQGSRLVPPQTSLGIPFDTRDVALAKMDETRENLRMIVPRFKVVSMTREVTVTRQKSEERTRIVENENGEKVEQKYVVCVPYTETVAQQYSELATTAKDRFKVPINLVSAWQLDGTRIDADELRQRAAKPMHFFVTRKNGFPGIPAYFREAFNPKMVVIFVGRDFAEKFSDGEASKHQIRPSENSD